MAEEGVTLCNKEVQDFLLLICNKSFSDVEDLIVGASLYEMIDIYEFGAEEYSGYWKRLGDEVCQEYLSTIAEINIFVRYVKTVLNIADPRSEAWQQVKSRIRVSSYNTYRKKVMGGSQGYASATPYSDNLHLSENEEAQVSEDASIQTQTGTQGSESSSTGSNRERNDQANEDRQNRQALSRAIYRALNHMLSTTLQHLNSLRKLNRAHNSLKTKWCRLSGSLTKAGCIKQARAT